MADKYFLSFCELQMPSIQCQVGFNSANIDNQLSGDEEMSKKGEDALRFPSKCIFWEAARHSSSLLLDFTPSFNLLR